MLHYIVQYVPGDSRIPGRRHSWCWDELAVHPPWTASSSTTAQTSDSQHYPFQEPGTQMQLPGYLYPNLVGFNC